MIPANITKEEFEKDIKYCLMECKESCNIKADKCKKLKGGN